VEQMTFRNDIGERGSRLAASGPSRPAFMAASRLRASGGRRSVDTPATYVQLGFIVISVPNLLVIVGMVVVFILALVAPFPANHGIDPDDDDQRR
jgi:hypothetical protein